MKYQQDPPVLPEGPVLQSALAGFANVLPFGKRKSARYAREIKSLSKEHHLSDIMASVQAANQQKKGDAPWQTV
jgi:hypothetical protein